ncbi:MAG TPA: tetratricopeptide repeat protein [Mariprofundaceae bacterium]|nr:tetratricopeptide repeat protein [Mariprofundaceae bacterium]
MNAWILRAAIALALTGCAGMTAPSQAASNPKPPKQSQSLEEMDAGFLYLAAQDAIQRNQPELAARFLMALVAKEPTAIEPRMELAELYIHLNQPKSALQQIEALRANPGLSDEMRIHVNMLYARTLFGSGKIDEAIAALSKLVDTYPDQIAARQILVQWLAGSGRMDEAMAVVQAGIKHEDSPDLRQLEAQLYMQQGNLAKARKALLRMRTLAPDDNVPVLMLSAIAIQMHKPAEAETLLRDYLQGHPDDLQIGNMLGRLLVQQGRIKEAIDIYEQISQQTGGEPDVLIALGLLYFQQGNYAAAAKQFENALDKRPDSQTHYYLGLSLEGQQQDDRALQQFQTIKAGSPLYPDAQLRIADIEFRQHKDESAIKRTQAILAAHPDSGEAYLMLSIIRLAREEYRLLLDETAPAMKLKIVPTRLLFNRAVAFDHFKQYDALEKSLRTLLASRPDDSEALNFLGYSLAERGVRLDEAERLVKRALKAKPNDGYYLDSLAWTYFKQGKYAEAIKVQVRAVGIVKGDPVMHEHLGDMYWKHGDHDKARAMWKEAIRLKHQDPDLLRKKIKEGI